ncbi:MAG: hypothetical protein KBD44_00380 [Candidatus Pacebacteria bacterium]|nr:hypothetical protein [Candidatus Paceibacterota bacterium]
MGRVLGNKKVLGATLVGVALVFGALTLNNLRADRGPLVAVVEPVDKINTTLPDRTFIPVNDTNSDGVEDWREEFVVQAPIQLAVTDPLASFTMPTAITDQVGIQVFESLLKNKANVQFTQSKEEIVDRTTDKISALAKDTLYTNESITVVPTEPVAIRRYANMMGQSLITNNVTDSEGELEIVYTALQTNQTEDLKQLEPLAEMYKKLRDDALAAPVPERFAKDHLNLINAYHAMYRNITDFQLIFNDPLVALLRIKRYQDDATALALILNVMYRNAAPFQSLFTADDPATVFIAFSNN